ncbi:hypothetical protein [Cryptosporangium sp. NPDC048952]|uniref:hypothetical protein n=1 Tax=Cryptosporangium sp. NPDC048952 TaxID=3363961 RepID=UPI003713E766
MAEVGYLPDGTPCYAPPGQLLVDGDRVCCHLCGAWFLSVASHLRVHGWAKAAYIEAFGLELTNPLTGAATRKRRSAALTARQALEPSLLRSQSRARVRARSGALTAAASAAASGRAQPFERRAKTLENLARINPQARADGVRRRAERHLDEVASALAARFGFPDFRGYLRNRLDADVSLAAISREAGLHKDWMTRHVPKLVPELAGHWAEAADRRADAPFTAAAQRGGFADARAYLVARHVDEHRSVRAIAAEVGMSRGAVIAALKRHGISIVAHATKRRQAVARDETAARRQGFASLADYVADRRARGHPWTRIAAESGVAPSTLRRRSAS